MVVRIDAVLRTSAGPSVVCQSGRSGQAGQGQRDSRKAAGRHQAEAQIDSGGASTSNESKPFLYQGRMPFATGSIPTFNEYTKAKNDPAFAEEFEYYLREFVGRPSRLYFAKRLTEKWGGRSGHIQVASQLCCIALGWIWKASVSVIFHACNQQHTLRFQVGMTFLLLA